MPLSRRNDSSKHRADIVLRYLGVILGLLMIWLVLRGLVSVAYIVFRTFVLSYVQVPFEDEQTNIWMP